MVQIDMVFKLFAILQKYDFSSKSQRNVPGVLEHLSCLRYCKSTIFQANHNKLWDKVISTTLFAILQKYDFSSKSQRLTRHLALICCCLRYCKSTIFQANHNRRNDKLRHRVVVCDTAKVRFFKQITTVFPLGQLYNKLFAILQKYDFSSKSQQER